MKKFLQTRQASMKILGWYYNHTHNAYDINDCAKSIYNIKECVYINQCVFHKRYSLYSYKTINIDKRSRCKLAHYRKFNIIKFSKLKRRM